MKQTRLWLATIAALLCSLTASAATITFADWTSTNKTNNSISSETYRFFTADEGGTLSFSWSVSSEAGYDKLIVTLDGTTILEKSGSQSGNYSNVISQGSHTLVVKYTKDSSESYGYDRAIVSNIVITGVSDVIDGLVYLTSGTTASVSGAIDTVAIAIPSSVTIDGNVYVVNAIGDNAFYGCSSLTSITIPSSVTSIGSYAFSGCSSLTSITLPEGVTSIEEGAFYECSSLTSVTIPESVTSIGDGAFCDCDNLKFLVCLALIPPTLGEGVFYSEDLGEIEPMLSVPIESLTDYRNAYGWRNLPCTNTTILYISTSRGSWAIEQGGDALKSSSDLGIRATADDSRQQFAIISDVGNDDGVSYYLYHPAEKKFVNKDGRLSDTPTNPVYFKEGAYANTSVVYFDESHYINIGGSNQMVISSWDIADAGNSCSIVVVEDEYDLTEVLEKFPVVVDGCSYGRISTDEVKLVSISRTLNELEIPTTVVIKGKNYSVTNIGDYAFQNCSNLSSITIPESVTSIGEAVFQHCSNLTAITLPEGVTSIGRWAFEGCSSLTSITIPESVTSIGGWAFRSCNSLTSITIPESVTSIGDAVFQHCSNLTSLVVKEGNATYDSRDNCNAIIETSSNMLIYGCNSTIIPNSVTSIRSYAFSGCSSLTSITIPSSVTSIGTHAFGDCSGLTSITIPESVTSIANDAFHATAWYNNHPDGIVYAGRVLYKYKGTMPENTSIEVKEGTISIGDAVFRYCSSLTSIIIPESVTSIGSNAFYYCTSLQRVLNLSNLVFQKGSSENGYIAYYAKEVINGIRVGDYVFQITDGTNYLVYYFGVDTILSLPENYNGDDYEIAADAFRGKSTITSIVIPEGVTSVGSNAFSGCSSLESVTLNCANVENCFGGNSSIKDIVLGEGVTSIGDYAFYSCDSLASITIPESVTSIGNNAFFGCSGLKSLFVGTNVDTYGENVFEGCTAVEELTVMGSVMPVVPSDKFTTIRMFSPGPLDTEEFDAKVYRTATLYVPKGSLARYQMADVWKKFWYIEEFDPNESLNVTLDRTTVTMTEGDVITLVAAITPQYIKDKTVTWNSSDTSVATVDEQGVVTAVAGGTATITATVDDKEAACVVTVLGTRYVITYLVDGDIVQTDSVTHGTAITLLEEPTKEGYTFSGWDKTLTTMPAEDVTISGTFTVNIYKVYYYVGEELIHTAEVAYGEAIPGYTYEPTGEGDMFEGWIGETYATMPAHDVTYTANITNGIDAMSTDNGQQTTAIYDLMGREVTDTENLKGGIYIVNGRKVVIK